MPPKPRKLQKSLIFTSSAAHRAIFESMGQHRNALWAHPIFHLYVGCCWHASKQFSGIIKGTWTTAVLFHQWESEKQTYTAAQVASKNQYIHICFSNPFKKILPRQGKLSTATTAQVAGLFVWESCLLWAGPDAWEGRTAQVLNNDVIHPKGKFLPDLIN